jgi:hypothetical protein
MLWLSYFLLDSFSHHFPYFIGDCACCVHVLIPAVCILYWSQSAYSWSIDIVFNVVDNCLFLPACQPTLMHVRLRPIVELKWRSRVFKFRPLWEGTKHQRPFESLFLMLKLTYMEICWSIQTKSIHSSQRKCALFCEYYKSLIFFLLLGLVTIGRNALGASKYTTSVFVQL